MTCISAIILIFLSCRREREFNVSIKFAAKADLHHLHQFLASRQLDVPHETIQVLDVVLRAAPSAKYMNIILSEFDFCAIKY